MAGGPANIPVEYRRTVRWALAAMGVFALKAVGLKMPKRLLLWCARAPMQFRVGSGRWQTVRLDRAELLRRFGQ